MAIEDAVTLAECLERARTTDEIPKYLRAYQRIREPRCKLVQEFGSTQGKRATLPDGLEQEERDRRFNAHNAFVKQEKWEGVHVDEVPESINSPMWMPWLLGHDVADFANRKLDEEFGAAKLMAALRSIYHRRVPSTASRFPTFAAVISPTTPLALLTFVELFYQVSWTLKYVSPRHLIAHNKSRIRLNDLNFDLQNVASLSSVSFLKLLLSPGKGREGKDLNNSIFSGPFHEMQHPKSKGNTYITAQETQ
jgi:hypothetical protein